MAYKYFLIIVCSYSLLLHLLRVIGLFYSRGRLFNNKLISNRVLDRWNLLLYYLAIIVILVQVIFYQLEIDFQ